MGNEIETSKRRLFQVLATGTGAVVATNSLPSHWARPVVSTAIIPAHASSTGCFDSNELSFSDVQHEEDKVEIELDCNNFEIASGTTYEAIVEITSGTPLELRREGTITCPDTAIDWQETSEVESGEIALPEGAEVNGFDVVVNVDGCQITASSIDAPEAG